MLFLRRSYNRSGSNSVPEDGRDSHACFCGSRMLPKEDILFATSRIVAVVALFVSNLTTGTKIEIVTRDQFKNDSVPIHVEIEKDGKDVAVSFEYIHEHPKRLSLEPVEVWMALYFDHPTAGRGRITMKTRENRNKDGGKKVTEGTIHITPDFAQYTHVRVYLGEPDAEELSYAIPLDIFADEIKAAYLKK
ncbi:MAG: hypothetical protein JWP89_2165 [Schlesneria sp.]|nr:hypothetical protein [Schlesneria sp.]